jgi:hypothetical protein
MGVQDLLRAKGTAASGLATSVVFNAGFFPYLGQAFSYGWWMVCFQLAVGVILAGAAAAKPAIRGGAALLLTVLTASTFLFTCDVCNAAYGAYMLSHNENGKAASVIGTHASHESNAVMLMFSGLVVVDVAGACVCASLRPVRPCRQEQQRAQRRTLRRR